MRCPKCHYLGFDSGQRCRNCGYDFSLAVGTSEPPELPIRVAEPLGPLAELSLQRPADDTGAADARSMSDRLAELHGSAEAPAGPLDELPLFQPTGSRERAPTSLRAARPPLAVRRPTPEGTRVRARQPRQSIDEPGLDLGPPGAEAVALPDQGRSQRPDPARPLPPDSARPSPQFAASAVDRIAAGLLDTLIVAAIDLTAIYFTLRLCNLTFAEIGLLPLVPLVGFFVILNGGYFTLFTLASGQTIGKMARHIKVVGVDGPLGGGQAVLRTLGCIASVAPAGIGLAAGYFGQQRVAFHDRLAGTRVIKVRS